MKQNIGIKELAKMIDHSLLHPTMTDQDIIAGCELASKYGVATACVKPYAIQLASRVLQDSQVGVCTVIAFPHGNSTTMMKIKEAEEVVLDGAIEIDMVVNIGKVLSGDWQYVANEIGAINEVVVSQHAALKVIFENDYLQDMHIVKLCEICTAKEVAFVKTSTGYGFVKQIDGTYTYAGATDHQLRLMRAHCPPTVGVKAAGGIRTLDDLLRVWQLGVTRIGATATANILEEAKRRGY